jgi:hypothetical protein
MCREIHWSGDLGLSPNPQAQWSVRIGQSPIPRLIMFFIQVAYPKFFLYIDSNKHNY